MEPALPKGGFLQLRYTGPMVDQTDKSKLMPVWKPEAGKLFLIKGLLFYFIEFWTMNDNFMSRAF